MSYSGHLVSQIQGVTASHYFSYRKVHVCFLCIFVCLQKVYYVNASLIFFLWVSLIPCRRLSSKFRAQVYDSGAFVMMRCSMAPLWQNLQPLQLLSPIAKFLAMTIISRPTKESLEDCGESEQGDKKLFQTAPVSKHRV